MPARYFAESYGAMVPNWMPYGSEVTVPAPSPDFETVRRYSVCVWPVNKALTAVSAFRTKEQLGVEPVHAPDQDLNWLASLGVAVRVMVRPEEKDSTHAAPQRMPDGEDET